MLTNNLSKTLSKKRDHLVYLLYFISRNPIGELKSYQGSQNSDENHGGGNFNIN